MVINLMNIAKILYDLTECWRDGPGVLKLFDGYSFFIFRQFLFFITLCFFSTWNWYRNFVLNFFILKKIFYEIKKKIKTRNAVPIPKSKDNTVLFIYYLLLYYLKSDPTIVIYFLLLIYNLNIYLNR